MANYTFSWLAVFISFLFAAVLELIVLPDMVAFLRPEWLVLTLIYWLLRYPGEIGIATGAIIGLVLDVLSGSYLGIHMLAASLICYLILSMHNRLKMFPVLQQSIVIFFIVGVHLMIVFTLRSALSVNDGGLRYLWQAFSSAVVWPVVLILYDRLVFALR